MSSHSSHLHSELVTLCGIARDGGLTPEQFARLETLLNESADARQFYVQFFQLHTWMMRHAAGAADTALRDVPIPTELIRTELAAAEKQECEKQAWHDRSQEQPGKSAAVPDLSSPSALESNPLFGSHISWPDISWWSFVVFALVAAVIGIGSAQTWLWWRGNPQPQFAQRQTLAVVPVAYLTSANGCDWGTGAVGIRSLGSSVHSGEEITLYEGIAEFRLSSGVSLSIEGPAALLLTSPTSLVLQHGKLTAHVPWSVPDFKVYAGACRLRACDAEFGVDVASNRVEVHAFSGNVSATPSLLFAREDDPTHKRATVYGRAIAFDQVTIDAGRALTLVNDGGYTAPWPHWHKADETKFATRLIMAGPLPLSQKYVDAVLKSGPIAYWRFESIAEGVVANEVPGGVNLDIEGDLHLAGEADNRVAEFGRPGSTAFLISPTPFNALSGADYSVEFWVKPSHVHRGGIMALVQNPYEAKPGDRGQRAFYLALMASGDERPGYVRFLHRDPPNEDWKTGSNCNSTCPYSLRRWQHVVAVKKGPELRLYINGKPAGAAKANVTLADSLRLIVGQGRHPTRVGQFIGQLDEMAVYDRTLTSAEIEKHYKLIKWTSEQASAKRAGEI